MGVMPHTDPTPPPLVCSLTAEDLAGQALEWTDLQAIARSAVPLPSGARSTYHLDHADAIEDLARREVGCCGSWLEIETARTDVLTVTITSTNPDGVALIRRLTGLDDS